MQLPLEAHQGVYLQCVLLHGRVFIGVTRRSGRTGNRVRATAKLFTLSRDFASWKESSVPTVDFALTTYHSQLVLVGGRDIFTKDFTNKLWTSVSGANWKSWLPSLPTARRLSLAVNTGVPEYLIVAGGERMDFSPMDAVDVLVGRRWVSVKHLPMPCYYLEATFHNGNLYLMGGDRMKVIYCKIGSLLAACTHMQSSKDTSALWRMFEMSNDRAHPVSFGQQLLAIGGVHNVTNTIHYTTKIHAHSPSTQSWLHVGDLPTHLYPAAGVVLPTGELLIVGARCKGFNCIEVIKASLKCEVLAILSYNTSIITIATSWYVSTN